MKMKVEIPLGENKTVAAEWKAFSEKIFLSKMPNKVQFDEMRKAFYAGFYSCLAVCFNLGEESEERSVEALETLCAECEGFFADELKNFTKSKN